MRFLAVIPSHWLDYVYVAGVAFCLGWGCTGRGAGGRGGSCGLVSTSDRSNAA